MTLSKRKYRTFTTYRLSHAVRNSPFFESANILSGINLYELLPPQSWLTTSDDTWKYYFPPDMNLPDQGWKIHLSSVIGQERHLLEIVSAHLFQRGVPFKHLISESVFLQANSKYANRASSGKFVTIYPKNDLDFCSLLNELEELTHGFDGPYILSDTKYQSSPVYFRYGGFRYHYTINTDGSTSLSIKDSYGTSIRDVREPRFVVPDFVSVPENIINQVHSRLHPDNSELKHQLAPFCIERSLHFSNGGGVYLALDESCKTHVILKEARKYAGYTSKEEDAQVRLRHERDMLIRLAGSGVTPKYLGYLEIEEHEFLVESYFDGKSLQSWVASEYPLSLDSDAVSNYYRVAIRLLDKLIALVRVIHENGIALMDISPGNFIVGPDHQLFAIDLEACRSLGASDYKVLGTPGFIPLDDCDNFNRDAYGLASLATYIFCPSWTSSFSPETLLRRMEFIQRLFPLVITRRLDKLIEAIPERLLRPRNGYPMIEYKKDTSLRQWIERLAAGIRETRLANDSQGRLYPGDATMYRHGTLGRLDIETGASGIALMLSRAGFDVSADVRWIMERLKFLKGEVRFHGLLRGSVGVICALAQMGFAKKAMYFLPTILPEISPLDISIRTGISGTVLALLEVWNLTNSDDVLILLKDASQRLKNSIEKIKQPASPESETGNALGLFDGWAGAAIASRELSLVFNENEWVLLAQKCEERAIDELVIGTSGELYLNYSGINFCYLSEGSAGILCSLAICANSSNADTILQIERSIDAKLMLNGILFHGMAGIIAALLSVHGPNDSRINELLEGIGKNFVFGKEGRTEEWYVLGNGGICLSSDYSSGAAGLIGVLASIESNSMKWFPVPLH